jgi:hypothetical protein
MTCRQLTADEAHKLDHLIDAFLTKGTLVTKPDLVPLVVEAQHIFGSFTALQRYVFEKTQRIINKPVEEYNEFGPAQPSRRPRLPFDADYDIVAEDQEVLTEYLNYASYPGVDRPDTDLSIIVKEAGDVARKRSYIQWKKENHGRD